MSEITVFDEKNIGFRNGNSTKIVRIICDTAEEIPEPEPEWEAGSKCEVLEDGGTVYELSNSRKWVPVNFYSRGGDGGSSAPGDLSNYYTKPQMNAMLAAKADKTDVISSEVSGETLIFRN